MKSTKYVYGTVIRCLEDIYSIVVPDFKFFTKGKDYVIQEDKTIINDIGVKVPFIGSNMFKKRLFRIVSPRYFLVTYMYQTILNGFATNTANVIQGNGNYINNKECVSKLKKINGITSALIITNIIELSKDDFEEYKRE